MPTFVTAAPASQPLLGFLVAGFAVLALGLALLTVRRRAPAPLASAAGTRRSALYALVFTLCAACFARLLNPALLGRESSAWLFALGDVLFLTLGLFVWVMVLAEGRPWRDYGYRGAPPARFLLALLFGLGAAAVYAGHPYLALLTGELRATPDTAVFALVGAAVGIVFAEETLFRGALQGSLTGRMARWASIALPAAAFAAHRAVRLLPGVDITPEEWFGYLFRVALPLGLWWGMMRDLAGGSLWPVLLSRFVLQFGTLLEGTRPGAPLHGP